MTFFPQSVKFSKLNLKTTSRTFSPVWTWKMKSLGTCWSITWPVPDCMCWQKNRKLLVKKTSITSTLHIFRVIWRGSLSMSKWTYQIKSICLCWSWTERCRRKLMSRWCVVRRISLNSWNSCSRKGYPARLIPIPDCSKTPSWLPSAITLSVRILWWTKCYKSSSTGWSLPK